MAVSVTLEITDTDPFRGRLVGVDGREHVFVGWLAFTRLVAELTEDAKPDPPSR